MEGEEIKPTKVSICYCSTRYIKAEEGELNFWCTVKHTLLQIESRYL